MTHAPAVQEFEVSLPQNVSGDSRIRIPPEMMPTDQQAMQYFNYFFTHIHPYVPVLHQISFYQTWNSNRDQLSPLLLEAIFAVTTMTLEDHDQGNKWLALATRESRISVNQPYISMTNDCRTRGELPGRHTSQHHSSCSHFTQSSRVCAQKRVFLSLLDECRQRCRYGQGS